MRRCGSRVAASDITTNVTCPGFSRLIPSLRDMMRHPGGKMLDTRTRLQAAMPAERSASSNEVSFSRCLPTPLVKNISLGTRLNTAVHRNGAIPRCQSELTLFAARLNQEVSNPLALERSLENQRAVARLAGMVRS